MGRHMKVKLEELTREQKYDIVESYKTAKDQIGQIGILADLYGTTPLTIRKVLREAGIDDHENDSGTRFTLVDRYEDEATEATPEEETEGAPEADACEAEAETISVSSGPFYRAEAILAIADHNDSDVIKEKAVELIVEIVRETAYEHLFRR